MRFTKTCCTRHCGNGCALLAAFDGERLIVRGDPDHPVTRGLVCGKTVRFGERLHAPDRITRPLLREHGTLREISWDTALDLAAGRIQALRHAPERMLHVFYVASYGVLFRASSYLFGRLGAAATSGDYCLDAGIEAQVLDFGVLAEPELDELALSRSIVNWGRNLDAEGLFAGCCVREARERGASVLAISPGDPGYAAFADRLVTIRPGTDRFLALAVLRILEARGALESDAVQAVAGYDAFRELLHGQSLEELLGACGVSRSDAEALAEAYARRPCATLLGRGTQRYRFGGENVRFVDALALLSGNLGTAGGGVYFCSGERGHIDYSWHKRPAAPPRTLPIHDLGGALERAEAEGEPIELVWIEGTNAVTQAPDSARLAKALRKPFVVAVEAFLNDTAEVADLILPPALMLEWEDITRCSAHGFVHHSAKVLDPPDGCLSNFEISRRVALRLDPPLDFPTAEQVMEQALDAPNLKTSLTDLRIRTWVPSPPRPTPFAGLHFAHADGRVRLPEALHPEPDPTPDYPWRLLTLVGKAHLLSQIPEAEQRQGLPRVRVAPDSPILAGLDLGRPVFLATERGRMAVRLELLDGLHPEVVLAGRGGWMKCGWGINALIGPHEADLAGQCAYYAQHCRLENDEIPA
ncbi:MAG: molybdopterin-dependent oxidoreductase [Desulfovibrio sp.]